MRVPSFEAASCWLDREARGVEERGRCLSFSAAPAPTVPSARLVGVRKSVTVRK